MMTRKITEGPIRNKALTKKELINSIGEIIEKEGFLRITSVNIARYAKRDKKLIYEYFGGVDELINEYLNTRDFWDVSKEELDNITKTYKLNLGKDIRYQLLEKQFDSLLKSGEMRGVTAWEINGKNLQSLQELAQKREKVRNQLFDKIEDKHFNDKDKNIRAIEAILMGGINYLTVHAHTSESAFHGIDVKKKSDQQKVKKALKQIIQWAYS